jgi:ribosome biogenesis GTPase A
MKAARQAIAKALPSNDVVVEVVDARMPRASSNPVLRELRRDRPCLKLLTKADLADPELTRAWVQWLEANERGSRVLAVVLTQSQLRETRSRILEACRALAPHRNTRAKAVRALVLGIPNVGKSTLINTLMERKVTKVSDQPGVTKTSQVVTLPDGVCFSDNAGVLWPRIDEASVLRLALGGALPDSELDYESVGLFFAAFLLERYPARVSARYGAESATQSPLALLEAIGRRQGGLGPGGKIDLRRAAAVLVHEFRSGKLGRITLEAPGDAEQPIEGTPAGPQNTD